MGHSQSLRDEVVKAVLGGGRTHLMLAEEFGVGRSTIQYWMRQYRSSGVASLTKHEKRPQDWTGEERLEALLATHGLTEVALGQWCRERGLHTHHLVSWRKEMVQVGAEASSKGDLRALRQENQALKKEVRRKDRALAETAALLVLKKKAAALWGGYEDD